MRLGVIGSIGINFIRMILRMTRLPADGRNTVDQRKKLSDIMPVCSRQCITQRNAIGVRQDVMFAAGFTAIEVMRTSKRDSKFPKTFISNILRLFYLHRRRTRMVTQRVPIGETLWKPSTDSSIPGSPRKTLGPTSRINPENEPYQPQYKPGCTSVCFRRINKPRCRNFFATGVELNDRDFRMKSQLPCKI